jgi:hypothetical protein
VPSASVIVTETAPPFVGLFSQTAAGTGSLQTRLERIQNLLLVGEFVGVQFGIDQIPIDGQLEAAALAGDQSQPLDSLFERGEDFARQTDGIWLVVSHRAVFKLHLHNSPSECGDRLIRPANATGHFHYRP